MNVVDQMLKIADLKPGDVLYDLGCGDGRIVIAAARQSAVRAVGVDLDAQRIRESRANAGHAGVGNLVSFRHQDLFMTDLSEATVITLFLFPDVNLRLRPRLLAEPRPGTRIVSYCHGMGQWRDDRALRVNKSFIYSWIVPSNVSGRWQGYVDTLKLPLQIEAWQAFQDVTGVLKVGKEVFQIPSTPIKGREFTCRAVSDGYAHTKTVRLRASANDDLIVGTIQLGSSCQENFNWSARVDPATKESIAR
jgi:SAM-dependent methyltransferase